MARKGMTHEEYQKQFAVPPKPRGKSLEEKMREQKSKQRQTEEDTAIRAKKRQDATTPRGKTLFEWMRSKRK